MKIESGMDSKMDQKPPMEPIMEQNDATFSSMWHQFTED